MFSVTKTFSHRDDSESQHPESSSSIALNTLRLCASAAEWF
jgi:hypothetical protein